MTDRPPSEPTPEPAPTPASVPGGGRRAMWTALLCLAGAGVLALVGAGRVWGRAELSGGVAGTLADNVVDVTGSDLLPAASALALVTLAALLAVPATRRFGRRVIGLIVLLAGLTLTVTVLSTASDLQRRVVRWVELGDDLGSVSTVTAVPVWPAATAAAGVVIAGAGLAVAVLGPRWPGMGARYERPTGASAAPDPTTPHPTAPDAVSTTGSTGEPAGTGDVGGAGVAPTGTAAQPDEPVRPQRAADTWDALDRGEDPT